MTPQRSDTLSAVQRQRTRSNFLIARAQVAAHASATEYEWVREMGRQAARSASAPAVPSSPRCGSRRRRESRRPPAAGDTLGRDDLV